jgi:hypothetical protein
MSYNTHHPGPDSLAILGLFGALHCTLADDAA